MRRFISSIFNSRQNGIIQPSYEIILLIDRERFSIGWTHLSEKTSLKFNELEHIGDEKFDLLFEESDRVQAIKAVCGPHPALERQQLAAP
jgi:hypothetical protein